MAKMKLPLIAGLLVAFLAGLAIAEFAHRDSVRAAVEAEQASSKATSLSGVDTANDVGVVAASTASQVDDNAIPLRWQNELDFLREELDAARQERARLVTELSALSKRFDGLDPASLNDPVDASREVGGDVAGDDFVPGNPEFEEAKERAHRGRFDEPTIEEQEQHLVAAGLDAQTATDLLRRADRDQLARLELIDQATREGWRDSEQFDTRLDALDAEKVDFRSELGDDAYDRYLFEAGRNNRVGIASVISGSAAEAAGLNVGDVVLSYADNRIFGLRELQGATREGTRGEYIQVTALRNGEVFALEVPRGPLGVTLTGIRTAP